MKIYLTGTEKDTTLKAHYQLKKKYPKATIFNHFLDMPDCGNKTRLQLLINNNFTHIYLSEFWKDSKICKCEKAVAELLDIEINFSDVFFKNKGYNDFIINFVGFENLQIEQLLSKTRKNEIKEIRHFIFCFEYVIQRKRLRSICNETGYNHATIISALKKIKKDLLDYDYNLRFNEYCKLIDIDNEYFKDKLTDKQQVELNFIKFR